MSVPRDTSPLPSRIVDGFFQDPFVISFFDAVEDANADFVVRFLGQRPLPDLGLFAAPAPPPAPLVRLGPGFESYVALGDVQAIIGFEGPQLVGVLGTVKYSFLSDGDDVFLSSGADYLNLSRGDDAGIVLGDAGFVALGDGDDTLFVLGDLELLRAGSGADEVVLGGNGGTIDLGRGDDFFLTAGSVQTLIAGSGDDTLIFETDSAIIATSSLLEDPAVVDGGDGFDVLLLKNVLGDFDVALIEDGFAFSDRLSGATTEITGIELFSFDGDEYSAEELADLYSGDAPNIFVASGTQNVSVNDPEPSVSVVWNRAAIESVINTDQPNGPTIASRAYAMVHTAIYDAWAAFDAAAVRIAEDAEGNNSGLRDEIEAAGLLGDGAMAAQAMSYAAFTILRNLYPEQEARHLSVLEGRYGLDPDDMTSLAARVGRDAANDLIAQRAADGANQAGLYADTTGYAPANQSPLALTDITRWTPESVPIDPEDATPEQSFLTPHWGRVDGFALTQTGVPSTEAETQLAIALADPGITSQYSDQEAAPEAFFTDAFANATLDLATQSITLDADSSFGLAGETIPVSKDLIGEIINPDFISQAEVVLDYSRGLGLPGGDAGKVSAEFYEDGGGTGFPPGTSMTFAEFVSADQDLTQAEEVLLFLSVGNAVFDAGIATWEAKVFFDYVRPVRAIRELGELGLIGEEGVDYKGARGTVVEAYIPQIGQTGLVRATEWMTYQTPGLDPSPPFAEFTSGHSAFSAAGAAALRGVTGSDAFGGSVFFPAGSTLFEPGQTPQEDLTITWDTFTEAADEAGLSRLFGGIHFEEGDFHGRALGQYVGQQAYELALAYYEGSIA